VSDQQINKKDSDSLEQMVTFSLGAEEYGVNILQVQEINRMVEITQVPQTEHYVKGIINLRGKVIPIIDLRAKFSMEEKEYDSHSRIVVVEVGDETVGLVVDSVAEVLRVPAGSLEAAPDLISKHNIGSSSDFIKAIVKLEERLLVYLDVQKIISSSVLPEMAA
jgi:purine-binding chemotaxis protein CheW